MAGRDLFANDTQNTGRDLFATNNAEKVEPQQPQQRGFLEKAAGIGEAALSIGSSTVAQTISGYAGIAQGLNPFANEFAGSDAIKDTRSAMTYKPRGEAGKEYIQDAAELMQPVTEPFQRAEKAAAEKGYLEGGPLGAAMFGTLPAATMEMLGLGGLSRMRGAKRVTGISDEAVDTLKNKGIDIDDINDAGIVKLQEQSKIEAMQKIEDNKPPEEKAYKTILKDIESGKAKKAAGDVMPDKAIMDAARELGIDLNPSHYSTNKAYIEIEQSLKSRPGSTLNVKELKAIEELGNRADTLINEMGGTIDKSLLDLKIKQSIHTTISDLTANANTAYNKVEQAINKSTLVEAPSSTGYINDLLEDLGGNVSKLTPAEKDLYKLSKNEKITYAALDRIRKDIGRGFKGKGIYKDEDAGLLKQAYGKISDDQQKITDAFGVGADYALGRKLVQDRKNIEKNAITIFGREVNKSIIPQMKASATAMTKGDVTKFEKLMDALPQHLREEAAVTMLGDLFVQDARSATGISQGFVKAFEGLNRNKGAKTVLFKYIPQEARQRFNNIGKVATGLYNSKSMENTSKTARDLVSAMNDGGMFSKISDVGKKVAVAEGVSSSAGLPGVGAAAVIASTMSKGRKAASVSADEFITSEIFTKAIKEAAEGNVKNANEMIARSRAFKNWVKFANPGDIEKITAVGFIPWIIGDTEESQKENINVK